MPRIIDSLRAGARFIHVPFTRSYPQKPQIVFDYISKGVDTRDVEVIYADNVYEYCGEKERQSSDIMEDLPNCAPPFSVFWVEARIPQKFQRKEAIGISNNIAVFCLCPKREDWKLLSGTLPGKPTATEETVTQVFQRWPDAHWVICGTPLFECIYEGGEKADNTVAHGARFFIPIAQDGRVLAPPVTQIPREALGDEEAANFTQFDDLNTEGNKNLAWLNVLAYRYSYFLLSVCCFFNCKNVDAVKIPPPEKLNKKRRANGKAPLVGYHVLVLDKIAAAVRAAGSNIEQSGIKLALALQRGHFKHYEKGRGLFGRWKGTYWWNENARGDEANGIVVKDYATTRESKAAQPTAAEVSRRAAELVERKRVQREAKKDQSGETPSRQADTERLNPVPEKDQDWINTYLSGV